MSQRDDHDRDATPETPPAEAPPVAPGVPGPGAGTARVEEARSGLGGTATGGRLDDIAAALGDPGTEDE
jgi:hypothetical protein